MSKERAEYGPMDTPEERWQVAHDYLRTELGWEEDRILAALLPQEEV